MRKWRQYLLGRHFKIFTNQHSLRHLLTQVIQTPNQHKWAAKLLGFGFEILYKPSRDNKVVDALSRVDDPHLLSITSPTFPWLEEICRHYTTTPEGLEFLQQLASSPQQFPLYRVHNGLVYRFGKIVVPNVVDLRQQVIIEHHATPMGGTPVSNPRYDVCLPHSTGHKWQPLLRRSYNLAPPVNK